MRKTTLFSPRAIGKLKEIAKEDYNKNLTDDEAQQTGLEVANFVLAKELAKNGKEEL